ncbi:MAG: amidase [Granulosicoccus sp.]|jgi:amidase
MQNKLEFSGSDLCAMPARDVVKLLKNKEVSPAELLDASYQRIAQVEPSVNAMPTLCEARARASLAHFSERARVQEGHPAWLGGLPVGIKDLMPVAGVLTTYGNVGMKDFIPEVSDPLVETLEERGALVVGKTNTPEFGAGGNTFNEVFGFTRNPWDTRKNAGGSSGGAAVSLATGEVWLSHGTDLAGSLRTPAAYCGVVGFRPSPGRAGGGPALAAFLMEATSGPMARDVEDVALFLDAMTGFDPRVPLRMESPSESFQSATARFTSKVRIAFAPDQNGFAPVEKEIREILAKALTKVERNGGVVDEACPELTNLYDTYVVLRGIHYGAVISRVPDSVKKHFKKTLQDNVKTGIELSSDRIYSAMRDRTTLYHQMREFLQGYDVLAIPVVGLEPGMVEEEYPMIVDGNPVKDYVDWLRFSFLATTTGLPAVSVPVGFTQSGMPVGIQLIGPPRGDALLLQVAKAVEISVEFPKTPIDPVVTHLA